MNRYLRTITAALLAVTLIPMLGGCVVVNPGNGGNSRMTGTGERVAHEFTVDAYDSLYMKTNMEVVYRNGSSGTVQLEIQENLLEYLSIYTQGTTLVVEADRDFSTGPGKTPILTIYTPELKGVEVHGAIELLQADPISTDTFVLDVSGACSAQLDLAVQELEMRISGAGEVGLSGTATDASMRVSGAGSVKALDLETANCMVSLSGSGEAKIHCTEYLDVSISGAGFVEYRGHPQISQSISGAGSIRSVS